MYKDNGPRGRSLPSGSELDEALGLPHALTPASRFIVTITDTLQLSKYPALQNLEKQTNVPKTYAVIGAITLYFFFIVFNLGGQLLTNLAGFAIPGYYSVNALFTTNKADDTQWLTVSCALKDACVAAWAVWFDLCANYALSAIVLGCLLLLHVSSPASTVQTK